MFQLGKYDRKKLSRFTLPVRSGSEYLMTSKKVVGVSDDVNTTEHANVALCGMARVSGYMQT